MSSAFRDLGGTGLGPAVTRWRMPAERMLNARARDRYTQMSWMTRGVAIDAMHNT
jgi:hypothetical protein